MKEMGLEQWMNEGWFWDGEEVATKNMILIFLIDVAVYDLNMGLQWRRDLMYSKENMFWTETRKGKNQYITICIGHVERVIRHDISKKIGNTKINLFQRLVSIDERLYTQGLLWCVLLCRKSQWCDSMGNIRNLHATELMSMWQCVHSRQICWD